MSDVIELNNRASRIGQKKKFYCLCCKIIIVNRPNNARYCVDCVKDIDSIQSLLNSKLYYLKNKFFDYNIKISISVKRKEKRVNILDSVKSTSPVYSESSDWNNVNKSPLI